MELPRLIPPSDLLEQVEGIENGLRQGRRLGRLGWAGLAISAAQVTFLVLTSDWWTALVNFNWRSLSEHWPLIIGLGGLAFSLILVNWNRFWLHESQQPFRYTYSIAPFSPVVESEQDKTMIWIQHDLAERLSERIKRLSLLELGSSGDGLGENRDAHIHIGGDYVLRAYKRDFRIEVTPRIRIGAKGNPETLAHTVKFKIGEIPSETPPALTPEKYRKLLERIYFSVATQIYKQIRQDVQRKIDLLPTDGYRAAAYLCEAEDYARSNTIDAYDEARQLYAAAMHLYKRFTSDGQRPESWLGRQWIYLNHALRPGLRRLEVMAARAEIGYVNMLVYRRVLAVLSGQRLNPIFEARRIAEMAVERLEGLPVDSPEREAALFDARVTLALAYYYLGDAERAENVLKDAKDLLPAHAEVDPRYLFAMGEVEVRLRSERLYFQRAVELDPKFEVAQFQLALNSEMLWRAQPPLEKKVAEKEVFENYERVLELNPGSIAAWANRGYMRWLLGEWQDAKEDFEGGREYKEIKSETFVAELDYGLARIAAEHNQFDFGDAYHYFMSALSAQVAQGISHAGSYTGYYFGLVGRDMMRRFEDYKGMVEARWSELKKNHPSHTCDAVYGFVLNDYGDACYNFYLRSGDDSWLAKAREAFEEAIKLNPEFAMPYYSLYALNQQEGELEQALSHIQKVVNLEPDWPDGKLVLAETLARQAQNKPEEIENELKNAERKLTKAEEQLAYLNQEIQRLQDELYQPTGKSSLVTNSSHPDEREGIPWQRVLTGGSSEQRVASPEEEIRWRQEQISQLKRERSVLEKDIESHRDRLANLKSKADQMAKEAAGLLQDAHGHLRPLLPHDWLWNEGELNWQALGQRQYEHKLHWEKEFDELQVRALFTKAKTFVLQKDQHAKAERLFAHIRKHFWPNEFEWLYEVRQLIKSQKGGDAGSLPPTGEINKNISAIVKRWRVEDPTAYRALSWITDEAFAPDIQKKIFSEVIDQQNLSPFLYQWVGTRLYALNDEQNALKAYSLALAAHNAEDLLKLGTKFLRTERIQEALQAYRKAGATEDPELLVKLAKTFDESLHRPDLAVKMLQRASRIDAQLSSPTYHPDFYHYHIGCLLWVLQRDAEAIQELDRIQRTHTGLAEEWRTALIKKVLPGLVAPESYYSLKTWLSSDSRIEDESIRQDIQHAIMQLVREKYAKIRSQSQLQPVITTSRDPVVTAIHIAINSPLFPPGEQAEQQEHVILKRFIPEMQERIQTQMGVRLPRVYIHSDNSDLPKDTYVLFLYEVPIVMGTIDSTRMFCPNYIVRKANTDTDGSELPLAYDPQTGEQSGAWVPDDIAKKLTEKKIELWEGAEYIVRHLESLLHSHLSMYLGVQETRDLLDEWSKDDDGRKDLCGEAVPDRNALLRLTQTLQALLREKTPICNLDAILSTYCEIQSSMQQVDDIVERVRMALRAELKGNERDGQLLRLTPEFERVLAQGVMRDRDGKQFFALPPQETQSLLSSVRESVAGRPQRALTLVVKKPQLRPYVRRLVELEFPDLAVISSRELTRKSVIFSGQIDFRVDGGA